MGSAKKQPEAVIQGDVVAYLSQCKEAFIFAVKNGGTFDPRIGAFRRNAGPGYRKGVSDLVGSWNSQLFCIEVKTPTGRLSPEQIAFRDDVIKAGGLYFVARSVSDIVDWVVALRTVGAGLTTRAVTTTGERNG